MTLVRRLARLAGWPLRRILDPRVRWTVHEIDARLGSEDLDGRPTVHDRLDDLDRLGRDTQAAVGWSAGPTPGRELAQLDDARAAFLNWANGPDGYAAQAGAWFNPPVPVEHRAGAVGVLLVSERIVEQPFVFGACAGLPAGARVLDVGGSESTVGLSLAALGHRVTVVDPRPHPLRHPNLEHAAVRLDELDTPAQPYDAAVVLSAVEHFGLDHYGCRSGQRVAEAAKWPTEAGPASDSAEAGPAPTRVGDDTRDDLAALRRLRELVRPDGLLVLTVPFGEPSVDAFQRVYDEAGLAELLEGWRVETSLHAGRRDRETWVMGGPLTESHGVALVAARPAR